METEGAERQEELTARGKNIGDDTLPVAGTEITHEAHAGGTAGLAIGRDGGLHIAALDRGGAGCEEREMRTIVDEGQLRREPELDSQLGSKLFVGEHGGHAAGGIGGYGIDLYTQQHKGIY